MHKLISLSFAILIAHLLPAQIVGLDIFPLGKEMKAGGFYIEPQLNTTFGSTSKISIDQNDSLYSFKEKGTGNLGGGLEIGWYHSFRKRKLIQYLEFAAAYRFIHGNAQHNGTLERFGNTFEYDSKDNFKNQYLTAAIRASNVQRLGVNSFLSTSLGINYNFGLSSKYTYELPHPTFEEEFHNKHSAQLHLKVGVGFRTSRKTIIMPTIETPLITAFPLDNINPAFPYFNSKFHPIFIGVKFMFLRDDPVHCNTPTFNG